MFIITLARTRKPLLLLVRAPQGVLEALPLGPVLLLDQVAARARDLELARADPATVLPGRERVELLLQLGRRLRFCFALFSNEVAPST